MLVNYRTKTPVERSGQLELPAVPRIADAVKLIDGGVWRVSNVRWNEPAGGVTIVLYSWAGDPDRAEV